MISPAIVEAQHQHNDRISGTKAGQGHQTIHYGRPDRHRAHLTRFHRVTGDDHDATHPSSHRLDLEPRRYS